MKNSFKRALSLTIVCILLAFTLGTAVIFAADKSLELNAVISNETLSAGKSFDYTLSLNNYSNVTSGVRAYKITVLFDSTKLSVTSVTELSSANELSYSSPSAGKLILLYADSQNGTSPVTAGEIAKIAFTVNAEATLGDTTIRVSDVETAFIDSSYQSSSVKSDIQKRTVLSTNTGASATIKVGAGFGKLRVNEITKYITNIQPGTTVTELAGEITSGTVNISNTFNNKIATGSTVSITVNEETTDYTTIIFGDVNSDSAISVIDLIYVKNMLIKKSDALPDHQMKAASITGIEYINILDLLMIKDGLLTPGSINQDRD